MDVYLDIDDVISDTAKAFYDYFSSELNGIDFFENMKIYNKISNFPIFKNDIKLYNNLLSLINSNKFQKNILPIEENLDFLINKKIGLNIIGYITARPINVSKGTKEWIIKNGFPNLDVFYKQEKNISDADWKIKFLNNIGFSGIVIDDNIDLLNFGKNLKFKTIIYNKFQDKNIYINENQGIYKDISLLLNHL